MAFKKKNPKKQKEPDKIQLMKSRFRTTLLGLLPAPFRIKIMLFSLLNLVACGYFTCRLLNFKRHLKLVFMFNSQPRNTAWVFRAVGF